MLGWVSANQWSLSPARSGIAIWDPSENSACCVQCACLENGAILRKTFGEGWVKRFGAWSGEGGPGRFVRRKMRRCGCWGVWETPTVLWSCWWIVGVGASGPFGCEEYCTCMAFYSSAECCVWCDAGGAATGVGCGPVCCLYHLLHEQNEWQWWLGEALSWTSQVRV